MTTQIDTDAPRTQLSDPKRALLEQRLRAARRSVQQGPAQTIARRPEGEPVPLSYAQRRLWFLDQLAPGGAAYNMPDALRLSGPLHIAALEQALAELVRRHEILRTSFAPHGDEAVQQIAPPAPLPLPVSDLSDRPEAEREPAAAALLADEAVRPFDLGAGPLLRARLLRLAADEHILMLTAHHIISDGWSSGTILSELATLYSAFAEGRPAPLGELSLQYGDFAAWQRRHLSGPTLEHQLAYWRTALAGAPTVLSLPLDRPRPPVQTTEGDLLVFELPGELVERLRALARAEGGTLFMLLLAAYGALLARYSGQDDLLVGSPVAGRNLPELEPLVGLFVNTLLLRVDLRESPSFRTALRRVREMALGAYAHQDLPFERLVEELRPERDLSHTPLFQVMFTMQNAPRGSLAMAGLEVRPAGFAFQAAKVDCSLSLDEHADGITAALIYNRALFDRATMERLAGHYAQLLAEAAADPDRPLAALPILTPAERATILGPWAGGSAAYDTERCIQQLVEAQVARTPDAPALRSGAVTVSYAALNERANRLAWELRARGVAPKQRVAICVERSVEMVVAMLGVLKAGGAYVPIDLAYPQARLSAMLEDADARLLLCQGHLRDRLPPFAGEVIDLDAPRADRPAHNPPLLGGPDSLAYLVFTSGSTGRPKGVLTTHRGVVNYLCFLGETYALAPQDVVLQLATFSFDASVRDTIGPLTVGAQVVLAPPAAAKDPAALLGLVREQGVTCLLSVVPTMLRGFFEAADAAPAAYGRLRLILLSGEILRQSDCRRAWQLFGDQVELVNQYGPTECTMTSTYQRVGGQKAGHGMPQLADPTAAQAGGDAVLVGRPLPNARVYLLDGLLQPVPAGVPGDLYIGGPGLARGYLNRPEQTEAAFIASPLAPGGRLYRTGDRARWRADGTIELLGRGDSQVKIRGQRVELGEIEALLGRHPAVANVAVLAVAGHAGDQRLAAYVVPRQHERAVGLPGAAQAPAPLRELGWGEAAERGAMAPALRAYLKELVPDYMIPAAFVELEALPRTPNGKLDRKALPAPEPAPAPASDYAAPETEAEARIAAIWAEVLGVPQVGIDDDFFDLGGDSFQSIRVARLVGGGMRVADLFTHPTVRRLAAALSAPQAAHGLVQLMRPAQGRAARALVCIPYGGGSAISFQPLARALPADHAVYAVNLPGHEIGLSDDAPQPLHEVARRCVDELRAAISGPVAIYGHCAGSALAIEIARRLEQAGVAVETIYLGGAFPNPRLPGKIFEYLANDKLAGDRTFHTFFRTLGGFGDALDEEEIGRIVRNLRHDSKGAEDYFTATLADPQRERLRAPVVCIVGDKDPLTEYYEERYREWELFSEQARLVVLPRAGHYFLKHRAVELAQIIAGKPAAEAAPAPAVAAEAARQPLPSLGLFLTVALGQFVSLIGSGLTGFALGVWVYLQTGSITQFALLSVAALLPSIIVAPIAGAIVDRSPRRRVMILADAGAALGTLTLATLLWQGSLEVWHIALVLVWNTICGTFQRPAYMSAIPQIVPKRYLWQANGVVQMAEAGGQLIAPVLAAGLVVSLGLPGIIIIDAITFCIAIGCLLVVRFPNSLPWRRKEPLAQEIANGWRYLVERRGMLALLIHAAATNLLLAIMTVLITPLVLRSVGDPGALGLVMAAGGLGMLAGGLAISLWGGPRRLMAGLLGYTVVCGFGIMIMGLHPSLLAVGAGFFVYMLFLGLSNGCYTILVQTKVPYHLHGRVFALNQMIAFSTMPLGFVLAGPLAEGLFEPWLAPGGALAASAGALIGTGAGRGIGLLLIIIGALTIAVTLVGYVYPRLWRLEDEVADANPDAVLTAEHQAARQAGPAAL